MNTGTTKRFFPGLGKRIRKLRLARQLSLQVAATRGATTPQTWGQLERFDLASTRTLNSVARVFGLGIDDLTSRTTVDALFSCESTAEGSGS